MEIDNIKKIIGEIDNFKKINWGNRQLLHYGNRRHSGFILWNLPTSHKKLWNLNYGI